MSLTILRTALAGLCMQGVASHAYMSDPEARNVPNNGDRQSLSAGGPWTVNSGGQYRHGLCGNSHTDSVQNWNEPKGVKKTYLEGEEIDISIVVTAHHIGYFDFQLCDTTDITEECFGKHKLRRADCSGSSSVDDPDCERWWKPLADYETMAWVVTSNGGYQHETVGGGTTLYKARFVLPPGVTCTNCVLRYHYYTTNSCQPKNANDNPGSISEEFWNCADIAIRGRDHTINTDASPALKQNLISRVPVNMRGTDMDYFCPRRALGEVQEYANVKQCHSPNSMNCAYTGESAVDTACATMDCGDNGVCRSGACICFDGFSGTLCDVAGGGGGGVVDPCDLIDCGQHSTSCNAGVCMCADDFSGNLCEIPPEVPDVCSTMDCGANGMCVNASCVCTDGFTGNLCEIAPEVPNLCDSVDCGTNGVCDGGLCVCLNGYTGTSCEVAPEVPDMCETIDCGANGACDNGNCVCVNGYTGVLCDIAPPDFCAENDCGRHSLGCHANACTCINGYSGQLCDTAPAECATVDCGANGVCIMTAHCLCDEGYEGQFCQDSIAPVDACRDVICGNHGDCENGLCTCTDGFTGINCEIAPAVPDMCDTIDCGANGDCENDVCVCKNGFSGINCEIVPEVPNACDNVDCGVNGTCENGICVCHNGFSGVNCGTAPEIPSLCDNIDCGDAGVCVEGLCQCNPGYSGVFCDVVDGNTLPTGSIRNLFSPAQFDQMFNLRQNAGSCSEGIAKLTYENFVTAVDTYYPEFANEGSDEMRLRELAAFLGQISQETTGWWAGQAYGWGLCFIEEVACPNGCAQYTDTSNTQYPPVAGKSYHGRGAIQITWNYNYGALSEVLFNGDKNVLLQNPDLLTEDGVVAFRASLWFWMTAQGTKPSSHDVMIDVAPECPAAGRYNGYGRTTNIINGGLECQIPTSQKVRNRVAYFERYCSILGVSPGEHLYCDQMMNHVSGVQCPL